MTALPAKTTLTDTYPNPTVATFKSGIGQLHDFLSGLLGTSGSQVLAPVGSQSAPGYAFTGVTSTGFYTSSSNINVTVGDELTWQFLSDGRLTAPSTSAHSSAGNVWMNLTPDFTTTIAASNNTYGIFYNATWTASNLPSTYLCMLAQTTFAGPAGTITAVRNFSANFTYDAANASTVTTHTHYHASTLTVSGGTVTNAYGYNADNAAVSSASTLGAAFRGGVTAATGMWNLYMSGTADNYLAGGLGIGSTNVGTTYGELHVGGSLTGGTTVHAAVADGTIASGVTTLSAGWRAALATAAASFTLTDLASFDAADASKGAGSTITNQYGFRVGALTSGTNNYGFYSAVANAANRYAFYDAGGAPSYFAGEVRVDGDIAGATGCNTLTGTSDLTANSTGVGTIKFKGSTSRDSAGFVKIYIGTVAYYVPVFSAITG